LQRRLRQRHLLQRAGTTAAPTSTRPRTLRCFHVESMPHGLEFLVIGSPGHAEVVPDKALCNEKQQLSLTAYQALLDKIKLSHSK
jgi:hypothetical protein